jgi:hypothetical protein
LKGLILRRRGNPYFKAIFYALEHGQRTLVTMLLVKSFVTKAMANTSIEGCARGRKGRVKVGRFGEF